MSDSIVQKLSKLNLEVPNITIPSINKFDLESKDLNTRSMPSSPTRSSSFPRNVRTNSSSLIKSDSANGASDIDALSGLKPYLQDLITRVDNGSYIQEIRELTQVPILIRAEIGMALPCLTVRALNPFCE